MQGLRANYVASYIKRLILIASKDCDFGSGGEKKGYSAISGLLFSSVFERPDWLTTCGLRRCHSCGKWWLAVLLGIVSSQSAPLVSPDTVGDHFGATALPKALHWGVVDNVCCRLTPSKQQGWLVAWGSPQAELQVVVHWPCQSSSADLQRRQMHLCLYFSADPTDFPCSVLIINIWGFTRVKPLFDTPWPRFSVSVHNFIHGRRKGSKRGFFFTFSVILERHLDVVMVRLSLFSNLDSSLQFSV